MKMSFCISFLFCCIGMFFLEATSLRLHNETNYSLRATVLGADGSLLADLSLSPQEMVTWNDSMGSREGAMKNSPAGFQRKSQSDSKIDKEGVPLQGPSRSITPMTVHWYCNDGENFCVSEHLTSGSLARTSQCVGQKVCKVKKESKE